MSDHNPGPIGLAFAFILDACLFLAQDRSNVVAVHCKAGKGRTGFTISCYLLFCELAQDTYQAIKVFNERRTKDGKGMGVASQKRYVHYFEKFLKSNFERPFVQALGPYLEDKNCYDNLVRGHTPCKLVSFCIGPFETEKEASNLLVQLSDF